MEHFSITKTDQGFHIDGFPDATKVFQLNGPEAKRLVDLALHKVDLDFALECLESINAAPIYPSPIRQALWRSAIVHFFKCFGLSNSRASLEASEVYEDDNEGLGIFKHLKNLRNKHLVHDENSYTQCLPGAVLNRRGLEHKIAKIICTSMIVDTLDKGDYSNLHLLCSRARAWVVTQFDQLCDRLTDELEKESYEDLERRESVTYTLPKLEDIDVPRKLLE